MNAPAKGQPYQVVEYLSAGYASECFGTGGPYGRAQSIKIVGPWGFCSAVPWDVSQAVIARALARLLPAAGARAAGVVKSVQHKGDVVQVQPAAYAALIQGLNDDFEAAVTTYKREPLYL